MATIATKPAPDLRIRGAELLHLPSISETRGFLVWGQSGTHLPFVPTRFWVISDVPPGQVRGDHGHPTLHELLVCLRGALTVRLDDGMHRDELVLDTPTLGLHVSPLTWCSQHGFTPDALLLVLGSEDYRPEGYIRDYAAFLALVGRGR